MILKKLFRSTTVGHGFRVSPGAETPYGQGRRFRSIPVEGESAENVNPEGLGVKSASDLAFEEQNSVGVNTESLDGFGAQNTSILRTCRQQLYSVAQPLLTPNILLHFASTSTMLKLVERNDATSPRHRNS